MKGAKAVLEYQVLIVWVYGLTNNAVLSPFSPLPCCIISRHQVSTNFDFQNTQGLRWKMQTSLHSLTNNRIFTRFHLCQSFIDATSEEARSFRDAKPFIPQLIKLRNTGGNDSKFKSDKQDSIHSEPRPLTRVLNLNA
jgi:hypothetical protein